MQLTRGPLVVTAVDVEVDHFEILEEGNPETTIDLGPTDVVALRNNRRVEWYEGRISGTGTFVNALRLNLKGGLSKRLGSNSLERGGRIVNGGIVDLQAGTLVLESGATMLNLGTEFLTGIIRFTSDADISLNGTDQGSVITNQSKIEKTAGTGTSIVSVAIDNREGHVEVETGTLSFSKVDLHYDPTTRVFSGGSWSASGSGRIKLTQADYIAEIGVRTGVSLGNNAEMVNGSNASLFRSNVPLRVKGSFRIGPGKSSEIQTVEIVDPDPEDPELASLEVEGALDCENVTVEDALLVVDGKIGDLLESGATVVITVTGGEISGDGSILGELILSDGGIVSPGSSPGILTTDDLEFGPDSIYRWEVRDFGGEPGIDFDQIVNRGNLTFTATEAQPMKIELVSLQADDQPGAAEGWDPAVARTWKLISNSQTVDGFDLAAIVIDTSGFAHETSGGQFTVELIGQDLVLSFAPSAFALWQAAHFPAIEDRLAEGLGTIGADPDGDGKVNFLEYALGANPLAADGPSLQLELDAGFSAVATFTRNTRATDVVINLQSAPTLDGAWSLLGSWLNGVTLGFGGVSIEQSGEPLSEVHVSELPAPETDAPQFFRLRVRPVSD